MEAWKRLKELPALLELLASEARTVQPQQLTPMDQPQQQAPPAQQQAPPAQPQQRVPTQQQQQPSRGGSCVAAAAPTAQPSPSVGKGPTRGASTDGGTSQGASSARKGGKHGPVRSFLLGWLPHRAPPRDLVERGILRNENVRPGSAAAATMPSSVFGGEMVMVLQRPDTESGIPRVVSALMARLRENQLEGLRSEGIFRISGDSSEIQALRRQINDGGDPVALAAGCGNLHSIAGLLKMFYREIQPPLLTFALYDELVACSSALGAPSDDEAFDCAALQALLRRLPSGHYPLLQHLVQFLTEVVEHTDESKMTVGNTAAVFAPNLLRPEHETIEHLADTAHTVNLIALFIRRCSDIFGTGTAAAAGGGSMGGMGGMGISHAAQSAESVQEPSTCLQQMRLDGSSYAPSLGTSAASLHSAPTDLTGSSSEQSFAEQPARISHAPTLLSAGSAAPGMLSASGCSACSAYSACSSACGQSGASLHAGQSGESFADGAAESMHQPELEPVVAADDDGSTRPWYFLNAEHEQQGPVLWADLQAMLAASQIDASTFVFGEGMSDWKSLAEVAAQ